MHSDETDASQGPPTEEIYLELRALESTAAATPAPASSDEPAPVVADDDPTGIKARIARLRAVLSDRGA
jgi:hypothetical protein